MNILTPEHAKELVNGFDSIPEAEKPKAAQLLKQYAAKRAEQGLGAFQTPPGVSRDRRKRFEALYADSEGLVSVLPEGERKAFEDAAASTGEPEEAKLRAVNQAWFAENQPDMADVAFKNWPAVRSAWAKAAYGVDKPDVGEKELFGLIGGKLAEAKQRDQFMADAFQALSLAAAKGETFVEAWRKVGLGMVGKEGWTPEAHDKFREAGQQLFGRVGEAITPLKPAIDLGRAYYATMLKQEDAGGDYAKAKGQAEAQKQAREAFVDALERLSPEQREEALTFAIQGAAEDAPRAMGEEGEAGFADKASASLERGVSGISGDIVRISKQTAGLVAPYWAKPVANYQYERREIERKVDEGLADSVDPIKSKSRIVQGVYDAIESLPYMGLAVVPYAGIPLTLAAMAEDNRQKFVANGVDKDEALGLGLIAAAPQVAIERLQANLVFKGRMPGFEKWLGKPATTKLELARKVAAVSGLSVATENAEEWVQDATPYVVQEVASMLTDSVPDANGTKEWNEVLAPWSKGRVDTFFALLPLALVGAGTATFKEASYGRAYLSDMKVLRTVFSEEVANKIATAETVQEKETLVQEEWAKRREAAQAESDAAAGDVGAMDAANAQAQADAFAALDADMKASFQEQSGPVVGASAVMQEDGSYAVLDKDGGLVDVAFSPEAAMALVEEVNKADDLDLSQAIQDMVDYFAPTNEPGQSIEVVDRGRTLQDKVDEGEISEAEAQRAVDVAIALGNLSGHSTVETVSIEGENVAQFNAKTGLFEDVSRIYQGANPLVVVEERSEGYLKRRIRDGSLTWKDVQAWRDAVEGQQADNSQRALAEWFSQSAKAWMVGEAENLNEGIPATFRAFLRAMKEYFAQVLNLARKLRELDAAGKLDGDFKTHLGRAVGLDRSHLEALEREAERKASGPDRSQYSAREALLEIGLPTPGKESTGMGGDLRNLWESLPFGKRMRVFRGKEKSLDRIAERLRVDYGFADVMTPDDVVQLAEAVFLRGEEIYSREAQETYSLEGMAPSDGAAQQSEGSPQSGPKVAAAIPKPQIQQKLGQRFYSSMLQDISDYGPLDLGDPYRQEAFSEIRKALKRAGLEHIDFYHATDASLSDFRQDGVRGSEVDLIGQTGGSSRDLSVYGFLDPDEIQKGYAGILGARGDVPNVLHVRIPVEKLGELRWDSNFNVTFGTYSGVRVLGNIPFDWIAGSYRALFDLGPNPSRTGEGAQNGKPVESAESTFSLDVTLPDGARLVGPATFSLKAYHGTPHKVDRFSTSKIGTGEGAQAYGWGLYFAESRGVAESYQKTLSPSDRYRIKVDGQRLSFRDAAIMAFGEKTGEELATYYTTGNRVPQFASERMQNLTGIGAELEKKGKRVEYEPVGNLYTVELLGDAEDFLDWDKPLSEQSEKVKAALLKIAPEFAEATAAVKAGKMTARQASEKYAFNVLDLYRDDGRAFYQGISARSRNEKQASGKLLAAGIKGIRYADAGSRMKGATKYDVRWTADGTKAEVFDRGSGQSVGVFNSFNEADAWVEKNADTGTFNYVIFDESLVRILEENGKPVEQAATTFSLAPAVESEAFKKWFGGSYVKNWKDGSPMVVYHGSPDVRGIFQGGFKKSSPRGQVWFAAADKNVAESYADDRRAFDYQNAEPQVIPLYLSIKNPLIIDGKGTHWKETAKHVEEARRKGHDGIIIRDTVDFYMNGADSKPTTVFAWFEPTQAKSAIQGQLRSRIDGKPIAGAIGNRGTFDGSNPDITFSLAAAVGSDAFKAWFRGSKVVDEAGAPKVVYHGTNQDFSQFSGERLGKNTNNVATKGFFFSESPAEASEYAAFSAKRQIADAVNVERKIESIKKRIAQAERRGDWDSVEKLTMQWEDLELGGIRDEVTGANVMPVFLRIENPFVKDYSNSIDTHDLAKLIDEAKRNGHDGLKLLNVYDPVGNRTEAYSTTQWIAFEPTQIKSATGNRGTFDPRNRDITFALAPKGRAEEMVKKLRERRVSQRIANADHGGSAFSPDLQARMAGRMYEVVPLKVTVDEALKVVASKGVTEVANIVTSDSPEVSRSVQVALGVGLVEHFDAQGNYAEAQRIAERVAELGTELGRAVNAFKLLGRVLDTPAKALVFFKRQVATAEKAMRERMPAAEAAQASVADVQKQAFKLFKRWIDEINGMTRLSKREAVRIEDLPEVTFSLTAEQKASGIVSVVARMLRESGADATETALLKRYGPAVEKALPDLFIEAQKLNTKRKTASGKAGKGSKRDSKPAGSGKGASGGENDSTGQETPSLTDEQIEATQAATRGKAEDQANLEGLEGFTEVLVNKVVESVRVKGLDTPEQVRDAVRNLFKVHGINATPETVAQVFKEKFKLPKMTDAQAERVSELAQNIGSTPEGSAERTDATIALVDYVDAQLKEVDIVEKAWAVWYANVLSGYNTHARNLWANLLSLGTELPLAGIRMNPMESVMLLRELVLGVPAGAKVGAGEGMRQLRTGKTSILRSGDNKFRVSDALEKAPFRGGNANPFNWLKVVKRLLTAEDLIAFATVQEAKARMVAWEMAKSSGLEGEALATEIERLLNNTEEQLADFGERAALEWDKLTDELKATRKREEWVARRVDELKLLERKAELLERSSDLAARATFNYRPEGSIGVMAGILMDGLGKVSRLEANSNQDLILKAVASSPKLVFPFIRIAANVLNRGLDYSGVGLIRGAFSKKLTYTPGVGAGLETKTVDERDMELKRGILGIVTMGLLSALASPDDDEAPIQIHGAGSGDRAKNQALNGPKWMPYSIEFRGEGGSRFITFQYSPLAVGLAILGNWHDARRYKRFNEEEANERLAAALTGAGSVILDQSFMSSAADMLKVMGDSGSVSEKALYSFLGRTFNPATAVPFSNLIANIDRDFDDRKRDATSIKASLMGNVPVVRRFNAPALDVLGDEMGNRPFDWFTRAEASGTPEARIYRLFAAKNIHPSNLWTYKGKMEPAQFYEFTKVRGQFIKDTLMADGGSLIESMMKLDDEEAKEVLADISKDATAYAKERVGYVPERK